MQQQSNSHPQISILLLTKFRRLVFSFNQFNPPHKATGTTTNCVILIPKWPWLSWDEHGLIQTVHEPWREDCIHVSLPCISHLSKKWISKSRQILICESKYTQNEIESFKQHPSTKLKMCAFECINGMNHLKLVALWTNHG